MDPDMKDALQRRAASPLGRPMAQDARRPFRDLRSGDAEERA